jgi:magnesium transporter
MKKLNPKSTTKTKSKLGLAPGALVFTGNRKVEKVQLHHLKYNNKEHKESLLDNHSEIILEDNSKFIDWYDLRGIHDENLISEIGKAFKIHPIALESVLDIYSRPKYDEYQSGILILIKAITYNKESKKVKLEHISIFFCEELLVSFQEDHTDVFSNVRNRILNQNGRVKERGSDYLAFALADSIVDNYYVVLEEIGDNIEVLEDNILDGEEVQIKERIHHLKKQVIFIRKQISPLREAISRFSKSDNKLIADSSQLFVRDLYDHTIQIMDMIDTHRDILNGLQDLYISEISNRMNQIMKVLTIITTLFVPLSFLCGLYGMNFDNIPELHLKDGYFILLGVMATIVFILLAWFRKKKWI